MALDYVTWKIRLFEINNKDLKKDNIMQRIEYTLHREYHSCQESLKWKKAGFDVNYLFEVESDKSIEYEGGILIGRHRVFPQPENNELTLLHLAARLNLGNIANALLGVEKINVNALDKHGWTPLHVASLSGHIDVVNALIEKGTEINIDAADEDGQTSLHWAVRNDHMNVVNALIASHANVNMVDNEGSTPLHWAARNEHIEIVRVLIEKGANPLLQNKDGKTPRDLAGYGYTKKFLKEAEEKQLREQNEGTSNLPHSNTDKDNNKDDNKDTTSLLGETEKNSIHQRLEKEFLPVVQPHC